MPITFINNFKKSASKYTKLFNVKTKFTILASSSQTKANINMPPQQLTIFANSLLYCFKHDDKKIQIIAINITFTIIFHLF